MTDDTFGEGLEQHSATSLTVSLLESVETENEYGICLFLRSHVFSIWQTLEQYKPYRDMLSETSRERIEWMVLKWFRGARDELMENYVAKGREERLGEIIASRARVSADKVRDHDDREAALHRDYRANQITWFDYQSQVSDLRSAYRPDDLVRHPIRGANKEPID